MPQYRHRQLNARTYMPLFRGGLCRMRTLALAYAGGVMRRRLGRHMLGSGRAPGPARRQSARTLLGPVVKGFADQRVVIG
jgi:hypothetical protein